MPELPWVRSISTVAPSPAPAPWQQGLEPRPSLSSPRFILWKKVTDRPGALHQQHMIPTPKSLQHTRPRAGKTGLWSTGDHQGVRDPGWKGAGVSFTVWEQQGSGACLLSPRVTGGQKRRRWLTEGLGTSEDLPPRTQGDRASPERTAPCQLDSP